MGLDRCGAQVSLSQLEPNLHLWCPARLGATMGGGSNPCADGTHPLQRPEPAGTVPAVSLHGDWLCHHRPSPRPLPAGQGHRPEPAGAGGGAAGAMVPESPRDDLRALRPGDQGQPVDAASTPAEQTL